MTTTMEQIQNYPESPLDPDEAIYPCKGCGEILEEGKAFELAGNRWHINCFRCNTCSTLLDSDANLLLLGDGSLICNNCTYSCSSCGDKIEDLAILTGDQAFCATCFKCRSCKRKIENLRYARTSQGIFCMECHEALMTKRRKKTARNATQRSKQVNIDKSLPAIPPPEARHTAYIPEADPSMYADSYTTPPPDVPSVSQTISELQAEPVIPDLSRTVVTPQINQNPGTLTLPSTTYRNNRHSYMSQRSDLSGGGEEYLIPLAFDPNPMKESPNTSSHGTPRGVEEKKEKEYSHRSTSHVQQSTSTSRSVSPHIAYQEKVRAESQDQVEPSRSRVEGAMGRTASNTASPYISLSHVHTSLEDSSHTPQLAKDSSREMFKLQEAPKTKRTISTSSTPRAETNIILEQQKTASPQQSTPSDRGYATPRPSHESSPSFSSTTESSKAPQSILQGLPTRGDSLESSKRQKTIPRKELNSSANIPSAFNDLGGPGSSTSKPSNSTTDIAKANGGKVISAPIGSPAFQSLLDVPNMPQRQGDVVKPTVESFIDPRAPPAPPSDLSRSRTESVSTVSEVQKSPKLPRWSGGGDFTLDEDMARILGGDEANAAHESFLRRVSNSVRHGRSYSEKAGGRLSRDRWPRSPVVGSSTGQEISSPITASPEHREELSWFKNELRRERQKNLERDKKITELETQLNSAADIKQANVELREKRSTMVVLDTQKEIVVRELEVLTEHLADAKRTGQPLNLQNMQNVVLKDFVEALEKLKQSFAPQIEALVEKRNDLLDEIANLTQTKDKSFQEFEQLTNKNAQLAEFNNQLVDQIQNIYKSNSGLATEGLKPNGLGIYSHHKEKSQVSIDTMRDVRALTSTGSMTDSGTTIEAGEAGLVPVAGGPQVVEIKKGQATKRFDWKRGQKMAKGLTKGVKGAFASTQQNYSRDMNFAETGAYGIQTQGGQEYGSLPKNGQDPTKPGWFANTKQPSLRGNGLYATQVNASTPSLLIDASTHLFGSDLEQRAEFEKTDIPGIVKRCVQEVEARGMDVEGIYRKSGGNSQVQQVKDGFERQPNDFDVSDPDLDIHAVTSGLKQYFRKLPSPLITYEVYDRLIEVTQIPEGPNQAADRIEELKRAIEELPKVHYDTLEYLIKHLARVILLEKENLMTSMNIAVVFAPTIMRPESVTRELSDTKSKNEVIMWIVEECEAIFRK